MIFNMNTHRTKETRAGLSLVETLVYLSVIVIVGIAVVTTFYSLRTTFERNRVHRELNAAAINVLERMVRETRIAENVGTGSVFDTSPGTLVLESGAGATTTTLSLSGNEVILEKTGATPGALTPDTVTVDALQFSHYTTSSSEAVRMELTLSIGSRFASTTETFFTTAALRGIYE